MASNLFDTTVRIHPGNIVDAANTGAINIGNQFAEYKRQVLEEVMNSFKEQGMTHKRAMEAMLKQYAPDEDTAWSWIRRGQELGWTWGLHDAERTKAIAFTQDEAVYVGICIVAGRVMWAWWTRKEWGTIGRGLILGGHRNYFDD